MKTAIMQPYLFPYLGYFQLINAVDIFVVYDDVQYIKGGWINRNKILADGKESMFTMSLCKDSYQKNINQRKFASNIVNQKKILLNRLRSVYGPAPNFSEIYQLVDDSFCLETENIAQSITCTLQAICNYLCIDTEFRISSELLKDDSLRGEDRVINICQLMKTTQYINAVGGRALYSKERFRQNGIELSFIHAKSIAYRQFDYDFVANLSIIDVLMFNDRDKIQSLLWEFEII